MIATDLAKQNVYAEIDLNLQMVKDKFSKRGIQTEFDQALKEFLFDKSYISEAQTSFQKKVVTQVVSRQVEDALTETVLPDILKKVEKQYFIRVVEGKLQILEKK